MAQDGGTDTSEPGQLRPGQGRRSADGPPDTELLRLHLTGDQNAFGTLFLRHKDRLWAVALRIVCDPDDAADALQDAMISAFRRAGDFRGDYPVAEAAVILGISEGTVKSRCARGRTRLVPYLSHLRANYPVKGNQPVADGVSSEQGGGV